MFDLHTHILPWIDDGARDIEESMKLLNLLSNQGVSALIATPHFCGDKMGIKRFLRHRERAYKEVMLEYEKEEHKNLPTLLLGAEVSYFEGVSLLEDLHKLTLADTKYILLEMPFTKWDYEVYNSVYDIIAQGFIPIIAHIERYFDLEKKAKHINKLLEMRVKVQCNASFFTNDATRKQALSLLKDGVIDVLGSDCHNLDDRRPEMDLAGSIIRNSLGEEYIHKLNQNSTEILYS